MSRVVYANTADTADQQALRAGHGVRLVSEGEEGVPVGALPPGVYGFTYSPGLPNAPLFATRRYRSYEIHKLATGEIFVVAFAGEEATRQIATSGDEVRIRVQPESGEGADVLVKVPYARIRQHRQYAAPNQDGFTVSLAPVSTGRVGSADHSDHDPA